jgi:hypothetical protein
MTAMTGLPAAAIRSKTACPRRARARPVTAVARDSSLMSAPAMKALSPAPVSRMTRTSGSASRLVTAASMSPRVASFNALRTAGRLMVSVATAPSRATSTGGSALAGSDIIGGPEL